VSRLAHTVVYEAREAVLAAVAEEVSFTGRLTALKHLEHSVILKVEDPAKDGSLEVFAPNDGSDDLDDLEPGNLVAVQGRCDVQADPLGATMRLIVRAYTVTKLTQPQRPAPLVPAAAPRHKAAASGPSRPFPRRIRRLAVVTSPGNAAIDDIRNALLKKGVRPELTFFECRVQGQGASASIAKAIVEARTSNADVVIIARGGDDGHHFRPAFDKPEVFAAVDVSRQLKPTVTGIGHARDTSDLVVNRYATHASATPGQAVHDAYALSRRVRYRQNAAVIAVIAAVAGLWTLIGPDADPQDHAGSTGTPRTLPVSSK